MQTQETLFKVLTLRIHQFSYIIRNQLPGHWKIVCRHLKKVTRPWDSLPHTFDVVSPKCLLCINIHFTIKLQTPLTSRPHLSSISHLYTSSPNNIWILLKIEVKHWNYEDRLKMRNQPKKSCNSLGQSS